MIFTIWYGNGWSHVTHSLYWALNFAALKRSQGKFGKVWITVHTV